MATSHDNHLCIIWSSLERRAPAGRLNIVYSRPRRPNLILRTARRSYVGRSDFWLPAEKASCYRVYRTWFLRYSEVKQHQARLVHGWVTVADRGLSHMIIFSPESTGTSHSDWWLSLSWDNDLNPTIKGHERKVEYFASGPAILLVGMTVHLMTGRHRPGQDDRRWGGGPASVLE